MPNSPDQSALDLASLGDALDHAADIALAAPSTIAFRRAIISRQSPNGAPYGVRVSFAGETAECPADIPVYTPYTAFDMTAAGSPVKNDEVLLMEVEGGYALMFKVNRHP